MAFRRWFECDLVRKWMEEGGKVVYKGMYVDEYSDDFFSDRLYWFKELQNRWMYHETDTISANIHSDLFTSNN